MKLYLVRHGESIGNYENRLQGQEDYDLTDLGRQQAERTARRLGDEKVAAIYTSPLLRAANTAAAIAGVLGVKPELLPDVAEYHFGEMAGATYAEVRERFAANQPTTTVAPQERVYPGEEGRDVFFERVTESLWRIAAEHPGQSIAVVSHGGPIALFCQTVLGLPYKRPMPFNITNCSLTVVEVPDNGDRDAAVLVSLNDTQHLDDLVTDHP